MRIAKCMRECFLFRKDAGSVLSILTLERCLTARSWHDSSAALRQLRGIGMSFVRKLALKGINTFDRLRQTAPEELEMWLNRSTPFGQEVLDDLEQIPIYELKVCRESHVKPADSGELINSGRDETPKGYSCHIPCKAFFSKRQNCWNF
jgi:hypothetical protein